MSSGDRKRVLGVIDHFGSGGAQRQVVALMTGLARRGHDIELFVYHPRYDFFRSELAATGIRVHESERSRIGARGTLLAFRRLVSARRPDAVVSFLAGPNILSEIGRVGLPVPRLLVSERSSRHGDLGLMQRWLHRALHALADRVVTNSYDHADWLEKQFPWLLGRVTCIYNGVGSEFFAVPGPARPKGELRLLAVGRIDAAKNPMVVARACALHAARYGWSPQVSWAGRVSESGGAQVRAEVDAFLAGEPRVAEGWRWMGETGNIPEALGEHHALVHPSRYEGLPNAVCEALAAGRPVLASRVGDAERLIGAEGERGYLFNSDSADELLIMMEKTMLETHDGWREMSARCKAYASETLTVDHMVDEYERLISA